MVWQRVHGARDSKEHSSIDARIIALQADFCTILDALEEHRSHLVTAQPPEEGLEQGGILEDNVDPPALAFAAVLYFVVILRSPVPNSPTGLQLCCPGSTQEI